MKMRKGAVSGKGPAPKNPPARRGHDHPPAPPQTSGCLPPPDGRQFYADTTPAGGYVYTEEELQAAADREWEERQRQHRLGIMRCSRCGCSRYQHHAKAWGSCIRFKEPE